MMKLWDLILAGRYEEACLVADEEFRQTSTLPPLHAKLRVLLRLGRYRDAATLYDKILEMSPPATRFDFILRGVMEWVEGREEAAIAAWQGSYKADWCDAAGGVTTPLLLFFASIKRSDQSLRKSSQAGTQATLQRT